MTVTIELKQLCVEPGDRIVLQNISWEKFEQILEELGEHRASRVAYDRGMLEIMSPLPEHEKPIQFVGDFVKILLEELEIDNECFGSTTFKRKDLMMGLEPDQCFYIKNHAQMRGMRKLDLTVDPPPDLAIEVDVTSKTQLNIYKSLGVPELWQYGKVKGTVRLYILILQNGEYIESTISPNFPGMPIAEVIPQFIQQSETIGRMQTIKAFRAWVRESRP
jgi:Uma2 family endonuclease